MTTKEKFEKLKEWVEDVVGIEFAESEAYAKDGSYFFEQPIGTGDRVIICFTKYNDTQIWILKANSERIQIYANNEANNCLCLDIFSHIIDNN